MVAAGRQAARTWRTQMRRMVNAGAKHVVVAGTYDLGKTPWATAISQTSLLQRCQQRFNEGLLVNIVDLGANVLYVDAAYYVNLYTSIAGLQAFTTPPTPVCTSVDAGNGIGIGTGQVNSALCTTATLLSGANQDKYVFADRCT
jgi:outer membrane lipase/esterase